VQLGKKKIAGLLSAATCSLLANPVQAEEEPNWDIDSAMLYYSEDDDRVSAFEPVISGKRDLGDEESLTFKLVLDSLSGASATGAVPSTQVQTFIRPSGNGTYTVDPNDTPLDDTFKDNRVSFSMNWEKPIDRNNRRNLGFSISDEYDFTSASVNALWDHDTNQKNTTYSAGINVEYDYIDPVGGAPEGLTSMTAQDKNDDDDRTIVDLLFGVTQVIDKTSLFQVNLSLSESDGYLTDPYKFVSIVDNTTGEPIDQLFENRPDSRSRQSLFGKYKKMFANKDILTASYRYMTDDWGIDSHTFDVTYRFRFNSGYFIQPHLRWYTQTEADFYYYFRREDQRVPGDASADYRLGDMDATTYGFKFGRAIDERHIWSVRLERYEQTGDSSPSEAFGQLEQQDLYPDVKATIVQLSYSFQW
jgi:hypothetical protein